MNLKETIKQQDEEFDALRKLCKYYIPELKEIKYRSYLHLRDQAIAEAVKEEIIKKADFEPGTSTNGWFSIYKDDLDLIFNQLKEN